MQAFWAIFLSLFAGVASLPEGPPKAACYNLKPGTQPGQTGTEGHVAAPQNLVPTYGNSKTAPYYILLSSERYTPGQTIYVSVLANQTNGLNMFRGILMQARKHICSSDDYMEVGSEPIGTFSIPPNSGQPAGESLLTTMDCMDIDNSAVAHKSPQFKINETVIWRAPDDMAGHVVFRATIVQYAHIYWTDVSSAILLDPSDSEPPKCAACTSFIALPLVFLSLLLSFTQSS